jgi:predicted acylesterase/phospholipase RssA
MKRRLDCDLVLEGAVTSAIIYLALVAGLSRRYRFRSLGGASSGAAVAAAAAIAEASRLASGTDEGFRGVFRFALWLGRQQAGQSNLLRMFQPAPGLRLPFRLLVWLFGLDARGKARLGMLAGGAGLLLAVAFVVGLGAALAGWLPEVAGLMLLRAFAIGVAVSLLGVLFAIRWLRTMGDHHFGMCTGMPAGSGEAGRQALTAVLHELFNKLLGRCATERPVVFAELWRCATPEPGRERMIDLQVVTSVLQQRRSLHLPGQPGEDPLRDYFYDPQEWRELFPEPVMEWLRRHARPTGPVEVECRQGARTEVRRLLALPEPQHLPVIVAVRLSVSFPGLLSAVPVYTLAQLHGLVGNEADEPARFRPVRIYFTDGGVTSNLPIHFFDEALPAWPTFAVNLFESDASKPTGAASTDTAGVPAFFGARPGCPETRPHELSVRPDGRPGILAFLGELFITAKDWRDTTMLSLPGFRERVLHIRVPKGYGTLNLRMSRRQVLELVGLGASAARRMATDFSLPAAPGQASRWEEHRWLRLRAALAAAQSWLRPLTEAGAAQALEGEPAYRELLRHPRPPGPPLPDEGNALRQAEALLDALDAAGRAVARGPDLGANLPEGMPKLHMGPGP